MSCSFPLVYNSDIWASTVSPDQIGIHEYLETLNVQECSLLHVGIGNSALYKQFSNRLSCVDGITIMDSEIKVANELDSTPIAYNVFKFNKYDISSYGGLRDKYDFVIDNNPKQHACCDKHWHDYFNKILDLLAPGGRFVTHTLGFASHSDLVDKLELEELFTLIESRNERNRILTTHLDLRNVDGYYPISIEDRNA